MATTSRNADVKETYDHVLAGNPIVPGQAINAGDFVIWDTTLNSGNGGVRIPAAQSDMATFLGTSEQQSPIASLGYNFNSLEIRRGGVVKMLTTSGEVYKHFTKLFWNETIDAQTITSGTNSGARTVPVGYALIPPALVLGGTLTVTGAAGVYIHVWLTPNFPVATI